MAGEAESKIRKQRIDPKLDAAGWLRPTGQAKPKAFSAPRRRRPTTVLPTTLWIGDEMLGVVEAKTLTVGPENVLTQAPRCAPKARRTSKTYPGGFRCPFIYSTIGEVLWFHDVRDPMNRSRRVSGVHTRAGLEELLAHDSDGACAQLLVMPHNHPRLRPYQVAANVAVKKAIAERKRSLLVAMATGTGPEVHAGERSTGP